MTIYVLIVMSNLYGYAHGAVVAFQEFGDKTACEAAAAEVNKAMPRFDYEWTVTCVPKSSS